MTTAANGSSAFVKLHDVHKSFGVLQVLRGVSIEIAKGEVICIIGPSGSGKSTILRCINALTPVDQGFIQVGGINVTDKKLDMVALCHKVGMVFQQYNLFPHKTVLQNITMAPIQVLKQNRAEVHQRARQLLEKVKLSEKAGAYPGELSGGQQQRVAIARTLCMQPEVILFDEVTAALDPEMVGEVLSVIREIAEEGMTCALVTHEMGFAREAADRIYFTDGGLIVESGRPAEIFRDPQDARTKSFLSKVL
jgi:polar amino acid transport system ATP-binding protein